MVARLFCAVARATLFGISAWTLPLAVALLLPPFAGTVRAGTPGVEWGEKLGEDIAGLLARARIHNPEFVTESLEAEATRAGVAAAGALPDPRFQIELMDVNSSSSVYPMTSFIEMAATIMTFHMRVVLQTWI